MYSTGNHIADGDYSAHVAAISAHWTGIEQSGYDKVIAFWGDCSDIEPGEEQERIDTLQYERKHSRCEGERRAFDEIIERLNTTYNA